MTTLNIARAKNTLVEAAERVQLKRREPYTLPNIALSVRVLSGTAWITSEAEDHVIRAGMQIALPRQQHPAVISALGDSLMIFEFRRA